MKLAIWVSMGLNLLLVPALANAESKIDMNEGQWQTTIKVEMPGMPMAIPPITTESCVTQKDMVPGTEQPGQDCKTTKQKVTGNTVEWAIECKDQNGTAMTGSGKITYKKDKFDGVMDVMVNGMAMKYTMTGKHIGACKKTDKK